ncbi:Uncharacterized protein OS=Singulisphaera acidiphila (strain ATCC BAA-1392 / DSM 18658 / VKM B-2454 / MOB10) GN=Sinac_5073 PE=4 SV=1 [Gemmata massiliana]|uniref:Uncharacterized protein n=1 Tax=Gemmata massiliana TaxID=1210884 RepID=A0A6P2CQE9_9BACT|nr:hypothetical protein [Gemmata massiliana]VTR91171.1 Uncharacterized protein OS=Singulisphaera acidiphila (strain ATCC BAA-1392 / DSM 18658 / VKM B-2454 / MOB10) GN=Sinac_5073 PE=4 SV=1 [Gemmata massiliana]
MPAHRYRAPTANGAVLAEPNFDAVPELVEANRKRLDRTDVVVGGLPLRELRTLARREVLDLVRDSDGSAGSPPLLNDISSSPDRPLLLAGHQPELSHPGVWVKNFALSGFARKLGGIPLNLVVDNDTLKSPALRLPAFKDRDPNSARLETIAFDTNPSGGELAYEGRQVFDPQLFDSFPDRSAPLYANWGYKPLLAKHWPSARTETVPRTRKVGDIFTALRGERERAWGCHNLELPVSRLAQTKAFARFVWHIWNDLPRFREVYNTAVAGYRKANRIRSANHPVPDLAEREGWSEVPFWSYVGSSRKRRGKPLIRAGREFIWRLESDSFAKPPIPSDLDGFVQHVSAYREIRPRALTLTLFARVCLGDFFIHGIGGGKYDEVTDTIIRDYFRLEPPAYQVLSATLHLPLPAFASTAADLQRAQRRVRELQWSPHQHLNTDQHASLASQALAAELKSLTEHEPPRGAHAARREWFRVIQRVKEQLRPFVVNQVPESESALARVQSEVDANAVLQRRDYSWVLYPEETLRPFLEEMRDRASQ